MGICDIRHWLGYGKWNGLSQMIIGLAVMITCAVAVAYNMQIFVRLMCGGIFFLAGLWTLTIDTDFRPCWRIFGCVYTPCCGEKREGKCQQCWVGMQVFSMATAVCVLTVSALFMSENPQRNSGTSGTSGTVSTPAPIGESFTGFNSLLIILCSIEILLCVAALVVFLPCLRDWYLQTKEEEEYVPPPEFMGEEIISNSLNDAPPAIYRQVDEPGPSTRNSAYRLSNTEMAGNPASAL